MPSYIIITILSCILFSIGSAMQKHGVSTAFPKISFSDLSSRKKEILNSIGKNWLWLVGVVFWFFGWILHFQALGMGDISVVQPLMNIQIFIVVIIGILILKEKLALHEWIGVGILLTGAVVLSLSATGKEGELKIMKEQLFILTGVVVGIIVFLVAFTSKRKGTSWEVGLAIIAGLLFSLNAIYMKATTSAIRLEDMKFALTSPEVWFRIFTTWYFYGVVIAGPLGFIAIQGAFSHGRAAIVVPIVNTVSMLLPVISAILIFEEQVTHLRIVGVIIILIGTLLLYRKAEAIS